MRGARFAVGSFLLVWASCTSSPSPDPLPGSGSAFAPDPDSAFPKHPLVDPQYRLDAAVPAPSGEVPPGGGLRREAAGGAPGGDPETAAAPAAVGVLKTGFERPVKPERSFEDVLTLQKDLAARNPANDDEKLRLALLQAASGNLEEAERILSGVRSRANKMVPYVEFFLRRQLGDHKEAGKLLAQFDDEERRVSGFVIERAELVTRVRRFREYTAAEHDRVAPGGDVHLYVEPRNFSLQRSGDKHTFHLRYEWRLYDDRAAEQPVPAWEKATVEEREDRVSSNGPLAEFYQSFHLPLPANLAAGHYRVKVTVTDVLSGKSDRAYVPITVVPLETPR